MLLSRNQALLSENSPLFHIFPDFSVVFFVILWLCFVDDDDQPAPLLESDYETDEETKAEKNKKKNKKKKNKKHKGAEPTEDELWSKVPMGNFR